MLSNHLILCCPLLLLPSIFCSIRIFSSELALHIRWPKYLSFSFSNNPSNEYSGLISFNLNSLQSKSPRHSQASSPAQIESISSSVLSTLYGATLTYVPDYWKTSQTEEHGWLQSMGSWRDRYDWSDLAAAAADDCSLRLLCPWDFPGNNTGMDCHFLLQGIFPTQGSNPGLAHL